MPKGLPAPIYRPFPFKGEAPNPPLTAIKLRNLSPYLS